MKVSYVSWDDDIPNIYIYGKVTKQYIYIYREIILTINNHQ